MEQSLFDAVGGRPTLEKVHKIFYDKVYADPWLGQFFAGHDQQAIELRQTQFMGEKMGGDIRYPGMALKLAHRRMYITEELFAVRRQLLADSIREAGVSDELAERWLKIDTAFKHHVVNPSLKSFLDIGLKYELPMIIPKPD